MDRDSRVLVIDTPITQINEDVLGFGSDIFQKYTGLFELGSQRVAIVGVAGKGPGADDC